MKGSQISFLQTLVKNQPKNQPKTVGNPTPEAGFTPTRDPDTIPGAGRKTTTSLVTDRTPMAEFELRSKDEFGIRDRVLRRVQYPLRSRTALRSKWSFPHDLGVSIQSL